MNSSNIPFVSLMYHNVCESQPHGSEWPGFENLSPSVTGYFVDRDTFTRHCEIIARNHRTLAIDEFNGLTRGTSADTSEEFAPPDALRVLLTFDDGWRGTVDIGGPILADYGLQGLLFVTTGLIGQPYFVDRRQLQRLTGQFVVGSHARSHRLLADLSDDEVRAELSDSKAVLEDLLGREVDAIAYPGGSFDRRVFRITQEAGYRWVFTSQPTVNRLTVGKHHFGRLAIRRGTSLETLERWLKGDVRRERLRTMGLEGTKRLLGRAVYRRLRSRLISEDVTQLEMTDLTAASRRADAELAIPN